LRGGGGADLSQELHAPLHSLWFSIWIHVFDAFHAPISLLLLRLPELVLALALSWTLVRLGEEVDAPLAGRAAALLFLGLPLSSAIVVTQQNYLTEALGGTFLAFHAIRFASTGRLRPLRFALATAFAVAAGYLNLMVFAWAAIVLLVSGVARGRWREALTAIAVAAAASAPFAWPGIRASIHLFVLSRPALFPSLAAEWSRSLAHDPMPVNSGIGDLSHAFPVLAHELFGRAGLLALAAALAVVRRDRTALKALSLGAWGVLAGQFVRLLLQNYATFFAPLVFGFAAALLPRRARARTSPAWTHLAIIVGALAVCFQAQRELRRPGELRWSMFAGADARPVRRGVASLPSEAPAVIFGGAQFDVALASLCDTGRGIRAWIKCPCATPVPPPGEPCAPRQQAPREVWTCPVDDPNAPLSPEAFRAFLAARARASARWRETVLVELIEADTAPDDQRPAFDELRGWLSIRCRPLPPAEHLLLWRCDRM
jgi:hypothetical protein